MAKHIFPIICVLITIISFAYSISSCNNGICQTLNDGDGQLIVFFSSVEDDDDGQLICINGKCNDDPNIGSTNICKEGSSPPAGSCNGSCQTLNDCEGQLICIDRKCNDDPDVGTHICGGGGVSSPPTPEISTCDGPCRDLNDCDGQLICINGTCDDDPDIGTHICGGVSSPPPPEISTCDGPCGNLNDCDGQLICINGTCNDDPDLGTHICGGVSSPPPPSGSCQQHGKIICQGNTYQTYNCSPQVLTSTSGTPANLTLKTFELSGPSKCEGRNHSDNETIIGLSTGWYGEGIQCGKMIRINGNDGRNVTAKVVDECDSMYTCEPCKNDIIEGSKAVWKALGLNTDLGVVSVTWSMTMT